MIVLGQNNDEKYKTHTNGLSIGAKYSNNFDGQMWVGIDMSLLTGSFPKGLYRVESDNWIDGGEVRVLEEERLVPTYMEVLVFGYARTIDQEKYEDPINDFSLDLFRLPVIMDIGIPFPNLELNLLKFGFMNAESHDNNAWYYRPEVGFSYGGLSLTYSRNINFKKDMEWTDNKHLINIRFSIQILKYSSGDDYANYPIQQ